MIDSIIYQNWKDRNSNAKTMTGLVDSVRHAALSLGQLTRGDEKLNRRTITMTMRFFHGR